MIVLVLLLYVRNVSENVNKDKEENSSQKGNTKHKKLTYADIVKGKSDNM